MTGPIATRLRDELSALDRAYSAGHHGRWSARRRAELVDAALAELFSAAGPPPGTALVAIGGYGRGALSPGSDVDLLVLHGGSAAEEVERVAASLLYPLWDLGLALGHAVRTPDEAEAAARDRLDTLTATIDARLVAGDGAIADRTIAAVRSAARADAEGFRRRLGDAALERRERYGSAAELLEPNLKEGAGGLRDVASLAWWERVRGASLEGDGSIGPVERAALDAAEEFLTRVRSALHLETGKRADRLVLDHQPAVARAMGFEDEPRLLAEDGLMRALFEHARAVDYVVEEVLIERRRPATTAPARPPADVAAVLRSFVGPDGAIREPTPAELEAAAALEPVGSGAAWSADVREAFLRILAAEGGGRALGTLDRIGVLGTLMPEWLDVRCRPQRDPYHRSTVDVHLRTTLDRVRTALRGDTGDPLAAEAVAQIRDHDALLLGALLHDIGKNGEGAHVDTGSRLARTILDRIGLPEPTRDLARFLVEQHLLLPDTATRRDLGDEELILDVASRAASPERLAALYLLAVADAEATGPAASTSWRRTLLRELVAKVQRAFERGEMGEEVAERLARRADELRALLANEPEREVDRFVLRMPHGYLLQVEPRRAARHFPLVAPPIGAAEVRTAAWPGEQEGTYELLVVAADRPGLLSWVAGSLTLEGLSILTAQVFTTDDGVAVDRFEVVGAFEPEVHEETWRACRRTLRRAIEGRVSLDHRIEEKRRHYPAPERAIPLTIRVDDDASDVFTVIEVGAADRIGVLYDLTRTLAELRLDVHLAKISTYADRVVDAFYVRDAEGRKLDPAGVDEVGRRLADRLGVTSPDVEAEA
jgi:[protein-PII] uridylyltransferase